MDVHEIISQLPADMLTTLAVETKVNHYAKKLQGEVVFKLLLHCILSFKDNSLRTMESAYESIGFSILNNTANRKISFSSISERLSTIKVSYFEKLYQSCLTIYGEKTGEKNTAFIRFDSTIVALSTQLLKIGYQLKGGDAEQVRQLKFTIGFSELPTIVHFYHEQKYNSENTALKETILAHQPALSNPIRIFDRGITARKTYDKFTEQQIPFISRIIVNSKHQIHTANSIKQPITTATLTITEDSWIFLFTTDKSRTKYPLRCIRGTMISTGEPIAFITNIKYFSAEEISILYKRRWDIEVFFKFLKQELNFSHLINRSENGIKVMLYATLIASILLLVYKKTNALKGYKIMKQRFVQEIEKSLVKDFVIMCGGNPDLVDKFLQKPPT